MAHTIAVAGKGGVRQDDADGTFRMDLVCKKKARLLAVERTRTPILNEVLGVEAPMSLGRDRGGMAQPEVSGKNPIPAGNVQAGLYGAEVWRGSVGAG